MSRLLWLAALVVPAALMLPVAAHADCAARQDHSIPKGQWFLHWENDVLTRFASDEYFTNGVRVGYSWEPGCERGWVKTPARWLERFTGDRLALGDPDKHTRSSTFAIGQSIYTPSNIEIADYLPDDHPYGGYLYALLRYDYTRPLEDVDGVWGSQVQKSFELQTGIVGPSSGGAEVQKWVHEVMDDKDPKGWDHQLKDEAGLITSFTWQRRFVRHSRTFDITPMFSTALGNVQSYASMGLTMRLGQNISGFPSRPVEAARVSAGQLRDDKSTCYGLHFVSECYVFIGGEARFVARNIFLDGNSNVEDGPSVNREPMVYDLTAGFRLRFPGLGLTFSYIGVRRSREFNPVPVTSRHSDGRHEYGVASFSWDTHF